MQDKIKLKGVGHFEIRDKITGKVLDSWDCENIITTDGDVQTAKLLNGVDTTYFRAIAIGVGIVDAGAGDHTLGNENQRVLATLTYSATAKAVFTATFTFGAGYAITEAGILNNSTSGGVLLDRLVFTAKNVDVTTNLYVQITITSS